MSSNLNTSKFVFPLIVYCTNSYYPLNKYFTASTFKIFLNYHFQQINKNIVVRKVEFLKSSNNQNEDISTKQLIVNKGKQNIFNHKVPQSEEQYRGEYTAEKHFSENKLKDISFVKMNMNTLIEIYFYSKPTIFISETEEILNRYSNGGMVNIFAQMTLQQYQSLHDHQIDISNEIAVNFLYIHHLNQSPQVFELNRVKSEISNWCISCEIGDNTLSHYLDIENISQGCKRINNKIEIKNHIIHHKESEFELVCEIFNGLAFKFSITSQIIVGCKLFEDEDKDIFYFSLTKQPSLTTVIKDYKVSTDIQFESNWKPAPPLLSSRYLGFLNHPLFNQYFINNNVLTIQTAKSSPASYFLRSFCFQIKHLFKLIEQPYEYLHMLSVLSKMNHNHFQDVNANMFIQGQTKYQLIYILKQLLMTRQLSMVDALNIFKMEEFLVNVEAFINVLLEMRMYQSEGYLWVKVRYHSLMKQYYESNVLQSL